MTMPTPGPELDHLVADRVMDWAVEGDPSWQPSTRMEHAWTVVESLRAKGRGMLVFPYKDGQWAAAVLSRHDEWPDHGGHYIDASLDDVFYAATAPHAICLAALRIAADLIR